jgi:Fe-S-cluster containining protein
MISRKLVERIFLIKGSPLPDRAQDSYSHRRGKNAVILEEDEESAKYDTFFEYEDDLAILKPSGEQYADMISDEPYVILEEKDSFSEDTAENRSDFSHIVMEGIEELVENDREEKTYKDVVGFDFIQCTFVKKDKNRCKRQAPKGQEICSTHRKYIEKHNR